MIAVIQRVSEASVVINNQTKGEISSGLLILLGITHEDTEEDVSWLTKKVAGLRIFGDDGGKMNLSVSDINGEVLVISQFTLFASTKKGNRPSFIEAAKPEKATPLYHFFVEKISSELNKTIQTGEFGADMKVSLTNDGPVTIIIDTKDKK